jgi:hypothetical protein
LRETLPSSEIVEAYCKDALKREYLRAMYRVAEAKLLKENSRLLTTGRSMHTCTVEAHEKEKRVADLVAHIVLADEVLFWNVLAINCLDDALIKGNLPGIWV